MRAGSLRGRRARSRAESSRGEERPEERGRKMERGESESKIVGEWVDARPPATC